MQPSENEDSGRNTRRVLVFTATVYALILAAVLLGRHHPPQEIGMVILGAGCTVVAVACLVLVIRMERAPLSCWVKSFGFLLIAASSLISGWWGDSRFTDYAIWLAMASFAVSFCLVWREYRRSVQSNTDQQS